MLDSDLSEYISCYGDRVAVKDMCRSDSSEGSRTNKEKLLDKLRAKISNVASKWNCGTSGSENDQLQAKNTGNRHAKKCDRRVELGWVTQDEGEERFKQVRSKTGGGTRHIKVNRNTKMTDLLVFATDLFFPDGISVRGKLDSFQLSLLDFSMKLCDSESTVADMHEATKHKILHFYLCTSAKTASSSDVVSFSNNPSKYSSSATSVSLLLDAGYIPDNDSQDFQEHP